MKLLLITPTLGKSPFLSETVDSICASCDSVFHVLSAPKEMKSVLAEQFPCSHVVCDGGNSGGMYEAINQALSNASNDWDYFGYVNDDDMLLPGYARMVERAQKDNLDCAYGDVMIDDLFKNVNYLNPICKDASDLFNIIKGGVVPLLQVGMIFSARYVKEIGGFDSSYRLAGDLDFILRGLNRGMRFGYVDETVARFRLRPGQLSGDVDAITEETVRALASHAGGLKRESNFYCALFRYRVSNIGRYLNRFIRKIS